MLARLPGQRLGLWFRWVTEPSQSLPKGACCLLSAVTAWLWRVSADASDPKAISSRSFGSTRSASFCRRLRSLESIDGRGCSGHRARASSRSRSIISAAIGSDVMVAIDPGRVPNQKRCSARAAPPGSRAMTLILSQRKEGRPPSDPDRCWPTISLCRNAYIHDRARMSAWVQAINWNARSSSMGTGGRHQPVCACKLGRHASEPRRICDNRRGSSQAEPLRKPHMNVLLLQRVLQNLSRRKIRRVVRGRGIGTASLGKGKIFRAPPMQQPG